MDKGSFYSKVHNHTISKATYLEAYEKTVGVSKRLEVLMCILLIDYNQSNVVEMKKYIDKCLVLLEEGGDWERKNK